MNYFDSERECNDYYLNAGKCYHLCTPENFDIIFTEEDDYIAGMSLIGLCIALYSKQGSINVYTFQLMSNHIHIAASGCISDIEDMFTLIKRTLKRYFDEKGRNIHWDKFVPKIIETESLNNLRNVIAYINRNGAVAIADYMPTTYPWGANRFYFNDEIRKKHQAVGTLLSQKKRQWISHSRKFDSLEGLFVVDGYISPVCFCKIEEGESFFSNARQYFNKISRNLENMRDIAQAVSESIYYTDNDLFQIAAKISADKYNSTKPSLLPSGAKVELAKSLHFDYNAGVKQLQRILRIDNYVLNELFPSSR